jgi:prepilin-type N-terminal cleavage/methylation domain-containing protein
MRRGAFTLIEMMISIVIFSLISVYLYGTLDTLKRSNARHAEKLDAGDLQSKVVRTLFLDLALSEHNRTTIINEEPEVDTLLTRTSHSVHRRIMPSVGYLVRDGVLYRFESVKIPELPIDISDHMIIDRLFPVERFRLYRNATHFLVDLKQPKEEELLLKVPMLN